MANKQTQAQKKYGIYSWTPYDDDNDDNVIITALTLSPHSALDR